MDVRLHRINDLELYEDERSASSSGSFATIKRKTVVAVWAMSHSVGRTAGLDIASAAIFRYSSRSLGTTFTEFPVSSNGLRHFLYYLPFRQSNLTPGPNFCSLRE